MQRFWANFWRIWDSIGHWLLSPRGSRLAVITLLGTQAGLLAYSATRHSPTHLEPAFLAAGISHWQFGRFELYRVNPPLVRMFTALPLLAEPTAFKDIQLLTVLLATFQPLFTSLQC
jgi:hypothetical protein